MGQTDPVVLLIYSLEYRLEIRRNYFALQSQSFRSQWLRGVRSAAARLLRLWVRNPQEGMDICCECCVLSGRGLCEKLNTRPEESYRLWCVVVCVLETSWMMRPWPTGGLLRQAQTTTITKLSARRHPEFTDQYQNFRMQSAVGKVDTEF